MRIEKISLLNYRQYQSQEIYFEKKGTTDLHIFIGTNGIGKTNILNAINWCLYGDEPHLSGPSSQRPITNIKSLIDANKDEPIKVSVELIVYDDKERRIRFKRESIFKKSENLSKPHKINEKFQVFAKDELNNDVIHENDNAKQFVNKFVPFDIREYFFFDGDRLENYFKYVTGPNIQKEIMQISLIGILQRIEDRLGAKSKEFRYEASKSNPDLELLNNQYEDLKGTSGSLQEQLVILHGQEEEARTRLKDLGDKIGSVPDLSQLELDRNKIHTDIKRKEEQYSKKEEQKNNFLFKSSIPILLFEAIDETSKMIQGKKDNGEFPPKVDLDELKACLDKDYCKYCGRDLDGEAKEHIKKLTKQLSLSSKTALELSTIKPYMETSIDIIHSYEKELDSYRDDINQIKEDLTKLNKNCEDIDHKYLLYNDENIKKMQQERNDIDNSLRSTIEQIGSKKNRLETTDKQLKQIEEKLKKATVEDEKSKKQLAMYNFCQDSIEIVKKTREQLLDEIREKIEIETNKHFFNLIWKKETFESIMIEKNYSVSIIDKHGISMLGSLSKGENQLIALAFTLALHEVSGFDSPILIDTPVARLSGEQRENFGETLRKLSEMKQTILAFTDDEYTDNIREVLQDAASNMYKIGMISKETTAKIERF